MQIEEVGMIFCLDTSDDTIFHFEPEVIKHFFSNKQTSKVGKEVGGQLFCRFEKNRVIICSVTGPRSIDRKGQYYFYPARWLERLEIKKKFKQGLHYIGDWHTHPQKKPKPSLMDIKSMKDCFNKSDHELPYFILVIVGQIDFPEGLSVSLHNGTGNLQLFTRNCLLSQKQGE